MSFKSLKDFDFLELKEIIAGYLSTSVGHRYLDALKPLPLLEIKEQSDMVIAFEHVIEKGNTLLKEDFPDLSAIIVKAKAEAILTGKELVSVMRFLQSYEMLYESITDIYAVSMLVSPRLFRHIKNGIAKSIDEEGVCKDDASPELKSIRERKRILEQHIRETIEKLMNIFDKSSVLRDRFYTIRNGRFVFPVKIDAQVSGIVHGYSKTEKTIYVEPYELVDRQNKMTKILNEEREEELRIKRELSEQIHEAASMMEDAYKLTGKIDFLNALALYKSENNAIFAEVGGDEIVFEDLYHPVLVNIMGKDRVKPLNLKFDKKALLISGPNAGGKTVALKTIGIAALSIAYGFPLIASKVKIPFVNKVYTVGFTNEQDIISGKSSFSGMLKRLKNILDVVSSGDWVLMDEPFSITDPEEGAALAIAIIKYILSAKARCFVVTHLWPLKIFAEQNDDVVNATVLFDVNKGVPLFELKIGQMGQSHALDIASKEGIPFDIIQSSKQYLTQGNAEIADLYSKIEREEAEVREKLFELKERERDIHRREEKIKKMGKILARREYEKAEKEIKALLAGLYKQKDRKIAIKKAQQVRKLIKEKKKTVELYTKPVQNPIVGQKYRIKPIGIIAELVSIKNKSALVSIGKTKMQVPASNLYECDE